MAESGQPLRVLVVEDSEDDVALILRELRRGGYDPVHRQVQTAAQLEGALAESPWDIVISDYSMPQFSGLAALEICASRGFELPFILVSGTVGEEEAVQAMKAGAQDYLMKDSLSRLAPAVRRELREAHARRERLRAEARLASILDTAADAIVGVDDSQRIVFFNQGAEQIFGYAAPDMLGQPFSQLLVGGASAGRAWTHKDLWNLLQTSATAHQQVEVTARRNDGSVFPAEVSLAEFAQDDGTYYTVILRNISDRKQAEIALRQADRRAIRQYEALLQRLIKLAQEFGAAQELLTVYRALARFVEESAPCNGLFIAMYEPERQQRTCVYAVSEGEEEDISRLPPLPLNASPQSRAIQRGEAIVVDDYQAMTRGLSSVNLGLERDPRLPQSSVAVPMSVMGRITGVFEVQSVELSAYKDEHVTALRMAANLAAVAIEHSRLLQQIQAQARHVQSVIDTMPDGVLLLDAQHCLLLANPGAHKALPLMATFEEGKRLTYLGGRSLPEILDDLGGAGATKRRELRIKEPQRVFEVAAQPVAWDASAGWVIVLRDVTDERRHQEHLQRQERLATVGQLAAGIAHDFNNVMAIIMLYSETLSRAPDHARRAFYLNTIHEQAEHAASLITQILDFSRRSIMERTRMNLLNLVTESAKLLQRTMPENIAIRLTADDDEYFCEADPTRLRQMLMNLAINARDAMPDGGEMTLTLTRLRVDAGRPPLPDMQAGPWIKIVMHDNGLGIPANAMPHLFEPFFTTKQPGRGTGLGLAQVYGIVKQHGGEIAVESQVGQGTAFTIYLPALETVRSSKTYAEQTMPAPSDNDETILLVEDDEKTRQAIQETLETLGYHVLTAASGLQALTLFKEKHETIDLILTDMIMPELGGLALHKAVTEWDPDIKIVLMTGYPLAGVGRRALEQGKLTWIQKPFSMGQLARILRQQLSN